MWQRLKTHPTQYGDNKNMPEGRHSARKDMIKLFESMKLRAEIAEGVPVVKGITK